MGATLATPRQKFSLDYEHYPQETYWGRFMTNFYRMDPSTLLTSEEELVRCQKLLADFRQGKHDPNVTDEDLWAARHTVEGIIHPDIHEKIPVLFRMSSFTPVNIPVCAGMVLSAGGPMRVVLTFQWLNQSYNAGFNYCNRNASGEDPTLEGWDKYKDVVISYGLATTVACSVAFSLNRVASRATGSPAKIKLIQTLVPFTAVATAGVFNAAAMRYKDALHGVKALDADGNNYGKSVSAGQFVLTQVCLTRVALPVPILLLPPYLLRLITMMGMMPAGRLGRAAWEVSVVTLCLAGALPLAVAIFPQTASLPASDLEPEFQNCIHPVTGRRIEQFYFNKGV